MRLLLASLFGLTASPAAAHDAPLAFVEAMEAHLLDCPSINGLGPNGDMLSDGWVPAEASDPILTKRADTFFAREGTAVSTLNIYTKTVETLELTQFMAARTIVQDGADPEAVADNPETIEATEYLCVTMVPDLPFMPSGKLLGAVFGKDVDVGIANTPGGIRDGSWVWDNLSPTHIRTTARYTNEFSDTKDLPDDTFYPGFYILSFRKFTQDNSE